ncbi:Flp family type IVb pilin [Vibrio fluminensis]|uniref:Flp family type IVb pilin n=1 Tax=Vibrio fluminensis TaxID=2783614 RepID=UPI001889321A|nr:Flp family type IVb pilin [Vibrio fluminensis]
MLNNLIVKAKVAADNFIHDQKGVTAIEYAIVGVAVSALVLAVFLNDNGGLQGALENAISNITSNIAQANEIGESS